MPAKRRNFTIAERLEIIEKLQNGTGVSALAKEMGYSRSTISTIWVMREKILQTSREGNMSQKKARRHQFDRVDQPLLQWVNQLRENNENEVMSGEKLATKAREIATELQFTDEEVKKIDVNWVNRWKNRYQILQPVKKKTKTNQSMEVVQLNTNTCTSIIQIPQISSTAIIQPPIYQPVEGIDFNTPIFDQNFNANLTQIQQPQYLENVIQIYQSPQEKGGTDIFYNSEKNDNNNFHNNNINNNNNNNNNINNFPCNKIDWNLLGQEYYEIIENTSIQFGKNALQLGNVEHAQNVGLKLIDVGCGCGGLAAYAHDVLALDVLATDFSQNMIEFVQKKYPQFASQLVDGQTLEGIQNDFFDYATSIFGIQGFSDRMSGWKSVHRVLKQGGQLMTAVWDVNGTDSLLSKQLTIPEYLPEKFKPYPYKNGADFRKTINFCHLSDQNFLFNELQQSGFQDIKIFWAVHSVVMKNRDHVFDGYLKLSADLRKIYQNFSEEEQKKWREDFFQGVGLGDVQGAFIIPARAHIAIARK